MLRNATIRHREKLSARVDPLPGGGELQPVLRSATLVELLLFDRVDDAQPPASSASIRGGIAPYHYWHVFVPGREAGQLYGYRVRGPCDPARGLRFDPDKVLLDPYGRAVAVPPHYSRRAAAAAGRQRGGRP